jgi:hypothetical protein
MSSGSVCCTIIMGLGFTFFGILYIMTLNHNEVFLEHKANGVQKIDETKNLTLKLTIVNLETYLLTYCL